MGGMDLSCTIMMPDIWKSSYMHDGNQDLF